MTCYEAHESIAKELIIAKVTGNRAYEAYLTAQLLFATESIIGAVSPVIQKHAPN